MSRKKKVIIITGGVAGPVSTEPLVGEDEDRVLSIEYNDSDLSDEEAEGALEVAVAKLS